MASQVGDIRLGLDQASAPHSYLTLIVPTRNEAGNVEPLLRRVEAATRGIPVEVIFVDDSTDETPAVISSAAERCDVPVQLIHRPPERRGDGLGGAVTEGMKASAGEWLCVMDGDLQHPPEVIPRLLDRARDTEADVVVASRFAPSG
jgi:dolichol-phosphate mannosyltransferase